MNHTPNHKTDGWSNPNQTRYNRHTQYPIIIYKGASVSPSVKDIRDFLDQLAWVMGKHTGPFFLYADAQNMKFMSAAPREMLAVGLRHLEDEYAERYKKFVFYIPKIHLVILQKIVTLTVEPAVGQKVFLREKNALKYLEKLKQELIEGRMK